MEECKTEKNGNKRSREDSEPDSAESKRVRTVEETVLNSPEANRVNPEPELNPNFAEADDLDASLGLYSPEAKQIREDILDILDEPETVTDLDSIIKSFEEEIVHPSTQPAQQTFFDLTSSDSGDPQPDLGYLLEASDDELGLPPTISSSEDHFNAKIDLPENVIEFENEWPSYDSFEFGMNAGADDGNNYDANSNGEFVTVDGLFDYQESLEFSEFSRRTESLPA